MARDNHRHWQRVLAAMNHAVPLCRGRDREAGTRWILYGLPGNVYFTLETPLPPDGAGGVFACSRAGAAALYDDADCRFAATLDVARAAAAAGEHPQRTERKEDATDPHDEDPAADVHDPGGARTGAGPTRHERRHPDADTPRPPDQRDTGPAPHPRSPDAGPPDRP